MNDPTDPTMSAAELSLLADRIAVLRDELTRSPDYCEPTSRGLLLEMDEAALGNAWSVLRRLYRWRQWPGASASYLPAPEPQPLRVQP